MNLYLYTKNSFHSCSIFKIMLLSMRSNDVISLLMCFNWKHGRLHCLFCCSVHVYVLFLNAIFATRSMAMIQFSILCNAVTSSVFNDTLPRRSVFYDTPSVLISTGVLINTPLESDENTMSQIVYMYIFTYHRF